MTTSGRPGVFTYENFAPLSTGGPPIPGEALPAICAAYPRGPIQPEKIESFQQFTKLYGDFTTDPGNLLPYAVNQFFNNGGSSLYVLRLPNTDATSASLGLVDLESPTPNTILTVTSKSPGTWGSQIYVEVTSAGIAGRVNFNVYLNGSLATNRIETFQDVSTNPADNRYIVTMVNSPQAGSDFVTLEETLPAGGYVLGSTDLALLSPTPLAGGTDGSVAPDESVVAPPLFDTLIDQALYINFPGLTDNTKLTTINTWAEGRGDVMLVVDGPVPANLETNTQVTTNYLNMVTGGSSLPVSTYITLYGPWILAQDPASTVPGASRLLPPGGAVLANWQVTDTKDGTVKTPAGVANTIKAIGLETQFTAAQLDSLNNAAVNAIKVIPGYGICVFGGRTLHPSYPDRYIAVRRMLIKIEHDIKWLLKPMIFEPNDADLWDQITSVLNTYLTQLLQNGQLGGSTPSDSFLVVCDSTLNTPATASAGIVNCNVAVSLLSPAEFINVTISMFQGQGTITVQSSGVSTSA